MRQTSENATGLTRQAVRAGTSMAVMTAIENGLLLLRTMILSRLLTPREFGLMGMAYIAIVTSDVLSQTGFSRAIVQRRGDPQPYLDTLWSVSALRGVALSLVLLAAAPLMGLFFRTPEVVPVVRLIALGPALVGLSSPRWLLLERDLRLARFAMPRVIGAVADLVVTSYLAWQLRSVYALAFGYLVFTTVMVTVTFLVGPCRPRLRVDREKAREMYAFGKHIFRMDVINYAVEQVERVTVGRLSDATALGLYSFAFRMATLPTNMIFSTLLKVIFPSFARIQDEPARVRAAYLRLIGLMAVIAFPVAAGLIVTAKVLVPVAFGEVWTPMVPVFQVLCVMACVLSLGQICGAAAGGLGHAAVLARASFMRLAVLGLLVIPATWKFGILGTAWCAAIAGAVWSLSLLASVARRVGVTAGDYLVTLRIPAAACLAMTVVVLLVARATDVLPPVIGLAALIAAGAAAYLLPAAALDRMTGSSITASFKALLQSGSAGTRSAPPAPDEPSRTAARR
jgi:O-antigen/teichoic acid export membrane protein